MRRMTALLVGGATAAALALGGLVGGVLAESPFADRLPPRRSPDPLPGRGPRGPGARPARREAWRRRPSHGSRTRSALARATPMCSSRSASRTRCAGASPRTRATCRARSPRCARALRARPDDPNAVLGLGSLALIRHEFRAALRLGRRAKRLLPGSARPYGVIGDALVELGRYEEAFAAFDRMVSLRPSLASYARVAYARELTGDLEGALEAMQTRAARPPRGQPEPTAWSLVELVEARADARPGRAGASATSSRRSEIFPGYPSARYELARVEAAARPCARAAIDGRTPRGGGRADDRGASRCSPTFSTGPAGRARRDCSARRSWSSSGSCVRTASGSISSRPCTAPIAVSRQAETVALARRARAERPSIYGDDALGWALARAGRCGEARRMVDPRPAPRHARTRCSSSTAGMRRAAPATGRPCERGTRARSSSTRSSRSAGRRSPARRSGPDPLRDSPGAIRIIRAAWREPSRPVEAEDETCRTDRSTARRPPDACRMRRR